MHIAWKCMYLKYFHIILLIVIDVDYMFWYEAECKQSLLFIFIFRLVYILQSKTTHLCISLDIDNYISWVLQHIMVDGATVIVWSTVCIQLIPGYVITEDFSSLLQFSIKLTADPGVYPSCDIDAEKSWKWRETCRGEGARAKSSYSPV